MDEKRIPCNFKSIIRWIVKVVANSVHGFTPHLAVEVVNNNLPSFHKWPAITSQRKENRSLYIDLSRRYI